MSRQTPNPKRKIAPAPTTGHGQLALDDLAARVRYRGSPYHKRNPGDFGLDPPAQPLPDKTLCDSVGLIRHADALQLLREGARRGLVSVQVKNGFPRWIWAVSERGALEALHDGHHDAIYHGYPLDSARDKLLIKALMLRWHA